MGIEFFGRVTIEGRENGRFLVLGTSVKEEHKLAN